MYPHVGDVSLAEQAWVDPSVGANWALDLHWRLLMHPALRDVFSFEDLWRRSVSLPRQPARVRGLSPIDALLHASMHYFGGGHRGTPAPLIWLLDIDLLWRELDSSGKSEAITRAADAGVAAFLGSALRLAAQHFGTPLTIDDLHELDVSGEREWRSWLVRPFRSRVHDLWFELRSEPGFYARLTRLISLVAPSREYMRWRYPEGSRFGVPGLYLRRVVSAVAKLTRR